jgi:hypothetical protein
VGEVALGIVGEGGLGNRNLQHKWTVSSAVYETLLFAFVIEMPGPGVHLDAGGTLENAQANGRARED